MKNIKINCIRAGQPRPYADSFYEYEIHFDKPQQITLRLAMAMASLLSQGREVRIPQEGESMEDYFKPHLYKWEQIDEGGWRILIVEHFTD